MATVTELWQWYLWWYTLTMEDNSVETDVCFAKLSFSIRKQSIHQWLKRRIMQGYIVHLSLATEKKNTGS